MSVTFHAIIFETQTLDLTQEVLAENGF